MVSVAVSHYSGVSNRLAGTARPLQIPLEFPGPVTLRELLAPADRFGDVYRELVFVLGSGA